MGYGLDGRVLIPGRRKRFVFSPQRPYRLWSPPSFLYNGYQGLFPQGYNGRDVKLTTIYSAEVKNGGVIT
jgi:hypothetical protein